jgi:lipoprotein-anchoring transpeptidase ErfK/SrfK
MLAVEKGMVNHLSMTSPYGLRHILQFGVAMPPFSRRGFILGGAGIAAAGVSGCSGPNRSWPFADGGGLGGEARGQASPKRLASAEYDRVYGPIDGERYAVQAFAYETLDPAFLRQEVAYTGLEAPGTIVVDPKARFLYRIENGRRATRYGVGVGREGFGWSGEAKINMKRDWPDWVPPREMVARDPEIRAQLVSTARGQGVPGGPSNPLGARAMYLFGKSGDTGYRIHGTTEPETIGTHVSSGCIRLVNQDVIHLYHRSPEGARVVVLA